MVYMRDHSADTIPAAATAAVSSTHCGAATVRLFGVETCKAKQSAHLDEHTKSTGRTSSTPFSAALACHASFYSYPMVATAAVYAAARGGVAYRRTMISGTILAPSASYKDVPMVMPWLTCATAATGGLNRLRLDGA